MLLSCAAAAGPLAAQAGAQSASAPRDTVPLDRVIALAVYDVTLRTALDTIASLARLRLSYSPDLLPLDRRVTLERERMSAGAALRALLHGTDIEITASAGGLVVLAPRTHTVRGRVVDAVTRTPVPAVAIDLDDRAGGTMTAADGTFLLRATHYGLHPLMLRRVGYQSARVLAGTTAAVEIALAPAALPLDRLDVVGPRAGTTAPERAHAVTVLRPAELAAVQPRTLGAVFGAAAAMLSPADGLFTPRLRVTGIRGATSLALSPPKIYLDGVELAQPQYAGAIDPAMIERIEIVRGPQGAALYGSDAIGGIVHIVTRKAAPGAAARLGGEVRAATGWMQPAVGDGAWTADQFAAGMYAGPRTAATASASLLREAGTAEAGGTRVGALAGMRAAVSRIAGETSLLIAQQTWRPSVNDVLRTYGYPMVLPGLDEPQRVRQVTAGMTLRFLAHPTWSHTLTIGHDHSVLDVTAERMPQLSPPDSTLGSARGVSDRSALRYSSLIRVPLEHAAALYITAGGDVSRLRHAALTRLRDPARPGPATDHRSVGARTDRGVYGQLELALPQLLLNAGVRAEHSGSFGVDHGTAWLPAIGAAYSAAAGPLAARWRAAWGRAIRPSWPISLNPHPRLTVVTDPMLAPESQTGIELGMDIDMGGRARLNVTRFDQTVDGLVYSVMIDSTTAMRRNIGRVENRGWEAELAVYAASFTLRGSHTATDSRITRLTRAYAGELRAGDRVPEVPASATALTAAFEHGGSGVALSGVRVGPWQSYDWIRLHHDRASGVHLPPRDYRIDYDSLLRLDLAATLQLSPGADAVLKLGNLTGSHRSGRDNLEVAPGRSLSLGVHVRRH